MLIRSSAKADPVILNTEDYGISWNPENSDPS
jgi:hypothetical protein